MYSYPLTNSASQIWMMEPFCCSPQLCRLLLLDPLCVGPELRRAVQPVLCCLALPRLACLLRLRLAFGHGAYKWERATSDRLFVATESDGEVPLTPRLKLERVLPVAAVHQRLQCHAGGALGRKSEALLRLQAPVAKLIHGLEDQAVRSMGVDRHGDGAAARIHHTSFRIQPDGVGHHRRPGEHPQGERASGEMGPVELDVDVVLTGDCGGKVLHEVGSVLVVCDVWLHRVDWLVAVVEVRGVDCREATGHDVHDPGFPPGGARSVQDVAGVDVEATLLADGDLLQVLARHHSPAAEGLGIVDHVRNAGLKLLQLHH